MKKKPKKRPTKTPEDRFLDAATDLLKAKGWKPMVIGGISVQQTLGTYKYNYEMVLKFTGVKDP